MRAANPDLEKNIRAQGLALLMEKEPEEIGMRDIAKACKVSATSIYYYYKDKESLFETIKLNCLEQMGCYIEQRVQAVEKTADRLLESMRSFRDWAFENPRIALLLMNRFKPTLHDSEEKMAPYYRSNDFAKKLLDQAVAESLIPVCDTRRESALIIAGLWGAIEAVILQRTWPEYWNSGNPFTDRMIELLNPVKSGKETRYENV